MTATTIPTSGGISRGGGGVASVPMSTTSTTLIEELWQSSEVVFGSRLTWLLVFGPVAIAGGTTGLFGEFVCFIFAGLALIPCAERLSFVTEQVAAHTNSTIGALLNATFGNAPEFLISSAALRAGFYRVVQLTLLGSILCNLLLVFGISCFIGGLRWQVQEVILTSGNVSIGLLLLSTAGLLLPAVLKLCGQEKMFAVQESMGDAYVNIDAGLQFSRFNAAIMLFMYVCYLFFQLATHKDEFDDDDCTMAGVGTESTDAAHPSLPTVTKQITSQRTRRRVRRNLWCRCCFFDDGMDNTLDMVEIEMAPVNALGVHDTATGQMLLVDVARANGDLHDDDQSSVSMEDDNEDTAFVNNSNKSFHMGKDQPQSLPGTIKKRHRENNSSADGTSWKENSDSSDVEQTAFVRQSPANAYAKAHSSDHQLGSEGDSFGDNSVEEMITLRAGIVWLLAITLCISAISDVIVDTIDGFAERCRLSEIFTSVIIVPFFSNIAEQVSAVLFAYRNKMDLCLGVTVGSAIQISTCVLPGCVLCGWAIDRSISLFFEGYETCCLVLGVLSVSAILHGGTTNWLAGSFFIGMYLMFAAGFWFHEEEDLSIDEELLLHNITSTADTP